MAILFVWTYAAIKHTNNMPGSAGIDSFLSVFFMDIKNLDYLPERFRFFGSVR